MAKDLYIPVNIRGGRLEAKAQLGQTVIVTEGPEKYTPVPITPSEIQQTIPTKDKQLTADVVVEPIPSEYIIPTGAEVINVTENGTVSRDVTTKTSVTVNVDIPIPQPTGTKEISISENGTTTEDVTGYANTEISVNVPIPPGYIIPTGSMEITENGQYDITAKASVTVDVPAPVPTGTKEISIMENGEKTVDVSGFALAHILTSVPTPQGGLEYETGTYIPTVDEIPTIYFATPHTTSPALIIFADVSATSPKNNRLTSWKYINVEAFLGSGIRQKNDQVTRYVYSASRVNTSDTVSMTNQEYTKDEVTPTSFKTYMSGNQAYSKAIAGQTYKWIAIWT